MTEKITGAASLNYYYFTRPTYLPTYIGRQTKQPSSAENTFADAVNSVWPVPSCNKSSSIFHKLSIKKKLSF